MSETVKRFVAFFDIMGFRDRVYRNTHNKTLETMLYIRNVLTELKIVQNFIYPVFFSDSILLVSKDSSKKCANFMITASTFLLGKAMIKGIPMKGAIAYGVQTSDRENSIHFGRPLIDAYELLDELYMYGAVLHHTMEDFIKKRNNKNVIENKCLFLYENTPLKKGGKVNHYTLNWTHVLDNNDKTPKQILSYFYNTSSGHIRKYIENTKEHVTSATAAGRSR
jgi:hypothetical protein